MVTKTKKRTSRKQRERRGFWFPVLILCLLIIGGAFWAYKSGLFDKLTKDTEDKEINYTELPTIKSNRNFKFNSGKFQLPLMAQIFK